MTFSDYKILESFDKLEEEIKDSNEYQRCPDYCKGCVQCDFWKKFDYLKNKFALHATGEGDGE